MSTPTAPRRRFLVRTATEAAFAPVAAPPAPASPADDEPLADRVRRQVREGLDRDRLLPAEEKRIHDLTKRLDRPPQSNGWATFVASQAHTISSGKARNRRNAEVALIQAICRWIADVEELLPDSHGRSVRHRELRAEPSPATASTEPLTAETDRSGLSAPLGFVQGRRR